MGELIGLIDIDMENLVRRARKGKLVYVCGKRKEKKRKEKKKTREKKKGLDRRSSI